MGFVHPGHQDMLADRKADLDKFACSERLTNASLAHAKY
jgi:hypothetical protein